MFQTKSRSRRSLPRCLFKVLGVLLLLAVGAYVVQRLIMPDVDLDKTQPIVISQSKARSDTTDAELANLPEGAITASITQQIVDAAAHPFDPLLKVAEQSIASIDKNVRDYTATLASQVFADGKLQDEKYLECKIRHAHSIDGTKVPFSVYTCFLKPKANVGQEVIWIEGQNDGKLIAHTTGLFNVTRFYLPPDGAIAMKGNRYPIRDIGMRNLIVKMAEIGELDRRHKECTVTIKRDVKVNGCLCTMLEAVHPNKREHFEFHIARIYIDDARNLPIAYEGYLWPEKPGDPPPLLEKYFYTNIKLNVGLTDLDFDAGNKEYDFPRW